MYSPAPKNQITQTLELILIITSATSKTKQKETKKKQSKRTHIQPLLFFFVVVVFFILFLCIHSMASDLSSFLSELGHDQPSSSSSSSSSSQQALPPQQQLIHEKMAYENSIQQQQQPTQLVSPSLYEQQAQVPSSVSEATQPQQLPTQQVYAYTSLVATKSLTILQFPPSQSPQAQAQPQFPPQQLQQPAPLEEKSLALRGLHENSTEDNLRTMFSKCGQIEKVFKTPGKR